MRILRNSVKCKKCKNVIESKIAGGLVTCNCGGISISGGRERLERYGNEKKFVERSVIEVEYERKVK